LTDLEVRDVVDHPGVGALVSYQSVDHEGLALNDAPNSWRTIATGPVRFNAVAVTAEGAFLAGTDDGITTFACAFSP
jgi:hypothetical protein